MPLVEFTTKARKMIASAARRAGSLARSCAAGEFLYSNGKMTTLPVPAGSNGVSAFAINRPQGAA